MTSSKSEHRGMVYLVGAGPGDPGMLTLRAQECLQSADVVLYDYLANARTLDHCRSDAELICLGQHARSSVWSQTAINEALIRHARDGQQVVRLKGGDPVIFGRLAEELQALRDAGIAYEIVPGVTAVLATGSLGEIPLTHREHASALAIVTGQENPAKHASAIDFSALARFPGTLAIYMGVTTAENWTQSLIAAGKPADTPCLIVRRSSWPDQQRMSCTLGQVATRLTPRTKFPPPVLVLVGEVVQQAPELSWFETRPLFGQTILVTRPMHQNAELIHAFGARGADVRVQPAIELMPPDDWSGVDRAIAELDRFQWLVFFSANGVHRFLDRVMGRGDLRALGGVRIAAVGATTARVLANYHLKADLVPDSFRSEDLADALASEAAGQRCLLVRGDRGRKVLDGQLATVGARVESVVVYRSQDVQAADPDILQMLRDDAIDWVTVTSSAIAKSLVSLFGDDLQRCRLASLSPLTSDTLRALGMEPAAEATTFTSEGLLQAIIDSTDRSIGT